jgi:hypothetical protein
MPDVSNRWARLTPPPRMTKMVSINKDPINMMYSL